MTRARKRPHGFHARRARARGASCHAVHRELKAKKRTRARAQDVGDETPPWSRMDLIRMDRAFCEAVRRAIARGTERARGAVAKPAPRRRAGRRPTSPRRSGASAAKASADVGERDRSR
jgi:hypothetical protein